MVNDVGDTNDKLSANNTSILAYCKYQHPHHSSEENMFLHQCSQVCNNTNKSDNP